MRKATRKLLIYGTNMIILLTMLCVGVWAVATPNFNFSVTVTYEQGIAGKVYIATSGIGNGDFEQQDPTVDTFAIGTVETVKESALIMDSTVGTFVAPEDQTAEFEAIDGTEGLLAEIGEIDFYVFIQNFHPVKTVYYKAEITLAGGGSSPFEVLSTGHTGSISCATGETGETPTNGLLTITLGIKAGAEVDLDDVTILITLSATELV